MQGKDSAFFRVPGLGGTAVVRHRGPSPTGARHAHESLCMGAVLAGERVFSLGGDRLAARAGDVVLLPPGQVHACPDAGESEYVMVCVPPAVAENLGVSFPGALASVLDDPFLFGKVLEFADVAAQPASELERQDALVGLLRALPAGGERRGARDEPVRVGRARVCLEEGFAEEISLGQLAELAGCSPGRLNRAFSRSVGMPPHEYQTLLRVREVKRLLSAGAELSEAAVSAGFFDQSHMTRCFRKIMGMTPGRFRAGLEGKILIDF